MAGMLDGGRLCERPRASDSGRRSRTVTTSLTSCPRPLALDRHPHRGDCHRDPGRPCMPGSPDDDQAADTPPNLLPPWTDPPTEFDDRLGNAVVQFDLPADLTRSRWRCCGSTVNRSGAIAAALLDLEARGVIAIERPKVRVTVQAGADRSGYQRVPVAPDHRARGTRATAAGKP